jgi:hypothetical protein
VSGYVSGDVSGITETNLTRNSRTYKRELRNFLKTKTRTRTTIKTINSLTLTERFLNV